MAVDVETLEESFDLVAPQGDELMKKFYDNLFEAAPAVQPLFAHVDMEGQRQALLNMLVVLRESLRDLDDIVPDLEDLGARHVDYGARAEHYPVASGAASGSRGRPRSGLASRATGGFRPASRGFASCSRIRSGSSPQLALLATWSSGSARCRCRGSAWPEQAPPENRLGALLTTGGARSGI